MNIAQRFYVIALGVLLSSSTLIARPPAIKGSFERTLQVSGPVDLEVTTGSGDITIS